MPSEMRVPQPNDDKMRELILYIATQSDGDDCFGATKLNKLLFYADFLAYLNFGQPITDHEYQALGYGPAPRRLPPIRDEMVANDEAAIRRRDFYGHAQQRLIALRDPDLSEFSAREIALVDRLIIKWWGMSATQVMELSHRFPGWLYAEPGETIPYEVALISSRQPTQEEIRRGLELEPVARECLGL